MEPALLKDVDRRFGRISGTLAALVLALPLAFLPNRAMMGAEHE